MIHVLFLFFFKKKLQNDNTLNFIHLLVSHIHIKFSRIYSTKFPDIDKNLGAMQTL